MQGAYATYIERSWGLQVMGGCSHIIAGRRASVQAFEKARKPQCHDDMGAVPE